MKPIIFYIILLLLLLLFLCLLVFFVFKSNEYFENDIFFNNQEIVISRYNEKLDWIKEPPFNRHPLIIYNKGLNENFEKTQNITKIINLPNVGRESHTYLYHIVNNYHNLADITFFLPGSTDSPNKYDRAVSIINKIEETNETALSCKIDKDIHKSQYNFTLDKYAVTNNDNLSINSNSDIVMSNIRPFGEWFKTTFKNNEENNCISWNAIIGISKENILQKPISFYENLLKEVDGVDNPETGHFIERSWYAVFYPYHENASFI